MAMAEAGAWGVSRILGSWMPTRENWRDELWVEALFGLSSRGVHLSAFQSWARNVVSGNPFVRLEKDMYDLHLEDHMVKILPSPRNEVYLESGIWGVSKALGTTLPTVENWLDQLWVQAMFELSSCGVQLATFQSWSRQVALVGNSFTPGMATANSITPRGLIEMLPNLFRNKTALKFKHPELQEFVRELDERRFYEKAYLEVIKSHMEQHRLVYWKRIDVTIRIELGLGFADVARGASQRIKEFYHSNPTFHGATSWKIVEEGSNIRPWVIQFRYCIGVHRTKKYARMIAIIKASIDPDFDPEGDSPPPPRMGRFGIEVPKRKHDEMMVNMAGSSTDDDAEEVAHKRCLTTDTPRLRKTTE